MAEHRLEDFHLLDSDDKTCTLKEIDDHSTVVDNGRGEPGVGLDRLGSGNLASVVGVLGLLGGEGKSAEGPEILRN